MATSNSPFDQALLYLRAAGHDTGATTRSRLRRLLRQYQAADPARQPALLVSQLSRWFDLPAGHQNPYLPPIVRTSIGYPSE